MPKFVPVPPVPVHHVTTAFVPTTPLAVNVVVDPVHSSLAADVADVIPAFTNEDTVTLASTAVPQSPVTLAKYVPGPRFVKVVPVPKFVPVPPVPVHHVTTGFNPVTPFAVNVVVADAQIEADAAVADVMPAFANEDTVTLACTAAPQSPVTLAKYVPGLREIVVPVPKFVPVPPVPVHHVTTAFVPTTPFAVNVVVADEHIELDAAVAEVMPTFTNADTVTLASTAVPQSPVTLAKYVPGARFVNVVPVPKFVPVPPVAVHHVGRRLELKKWEPMQQVILLSRM